MTSNLGIGVPISKKEKGNFALLVSEFDIMSEDALELGELVDKEPRFYMLIVVGVRRSVQGLPFNTGLHFQFPKAIGKE